MNKETFLSRLEQLLYDIPGEEREEAMDYYRSYFEEAGVENEAAVLEELDSPREIAASIKEDLKRPGREAGHLKNPPQVRTEGTKSKSSDEQKSFDKKGPQYRRYDESGKEGAAYRGYKEPEKEGDGNFGYDESSREDARYRRYDEPRQDSQSSYSGSSSYYGQYEKQTRSKRTGGMDNMAKLILLIILAVFAFPIWGSAASIVLGIVGIAIAAVVVLAVFSVGGMIGGLVCVIVGIVNLCMLSLIKGLLALGTGMLLIAAGAVSLVIILVVCGRFLPWAVRQIVSLLRRLLDWGRSIA